MRNKRQLFNATDFQSLMYLCFIFCRMLGIFPYKINNSTFTASKPHYILSIVIVCVSCVLYLQLIHDIIILKIDFKNGFRNVEYIIYFTLAGFMVISTHVLNGPRMRLLQTILEISSKLSLESYQKMSKFIHVKDILGIIFKMIQVYIYISKIQSEENCKIVMNIIFILYCNLLVYQINMLYINCVYILKACFKSINDNLAHVQKLMINHVKPSVPNLICFMERNQFLLIGLKTLKKQHLMTSDTVKMLNIIFSVQLLITIVTISCHITSQVYFNVIQWQDAMLFNQKSRDILLIFLIHHIILITLLVWVCETGKNQAQEIRITVHDLLNSTNDEQIKNEVIMYFYLYIFSKVYYTLMRLF